LWAYLTKQAHLEILCELVKTWSRKKLYLHLMYRYLKISFLSLHYFL
jgi:hypothetical protein